MVFVFSGRELYNDLQERIDYTHWYDDPAHPYVYGCELGRLLRLFVDSMMHEAEHKLSDYKNEQENAEYLVAALETFGLEEIMASVK